jgi:hypothetical protein
MTKLNEERQWLSPRCLKRGDAGRGLPFTIGIWVLLVLSH